jgi:hypothetical protein
MITVVAANLTRSRVAAFPAARSDADRLERQHHRPPGGSVLITGRHACLPLRVAAPDSLACRWGNSSPASGIAPPPVRRHVDVTSYRASGTVWLLQRGRVVISQRSRHIGRRSDDVASPATWAIASSALAISSSAAPAASARPVLHSRHTPGDQVATHALPAAAPRPWDPEPTTRLDQARIRPGLRRSLRRTSPACAGSPGISPSDPPDSPTVTAP